jgi:hypothetical protein
MIEAIQVFSKNSHRILLMRITQHFFYFRLYLLMMLAHIGKSRFVVVEQRDVSRLLNAPAEDKGRYVPSDLNNGLERPAYAPVPT